MPARIAGSELDDQPFVPSGLRDAHSHARSARPRPMTDRAADAADAERVRAAILLRSGRTACGPGRPESRSRPDAGPDTETPGARSMPWGDVIVRTSPSCIVELVGGLRVDFNPRPCHITVVIGSGISCSHGRCAVRPSANAADGYTCSTNGICVRVTCKRPRRDRLLRHHEIHARRRDSLACLLSALCSLALPVAGHSRIRRLRRPF